VTLLASRVLQNSPQFIIPGIEVWTPRGSILGADMAGTFLRSHSSAVLAFGQELSPAGRPIPDH
jgi:hypothetical protein